MTAMNDRMTEATRLTREGRLQEAMAVLQGGPIATAEAPAPQAAPRGAPPMIDMVPPQGGAGAWTAPGGAAPGPKAAGGLAEGLAETLAKAMPGGLSRAMAEFFLGQPAPAGA